MLNEWIDGKIISAVVMNKSAKLPISLNVLSCEYLKTITRYVITLPFSRLGIPVNILGVPNL